MLAAMMETAQSRAEDARAVALRAHFEAARAASIQAGARYRLALMAEEPDPAAVAELADAAARAALQVAGFARMLARSTPAATLRIP